MFDDNIESPEEPRQLFKSAAQFSMFIEHIAVERKMTHMDAVLKYCEENFVEPEDIKNLINKSLRDKIEVDMINENMLPKRATLEVE
jgi:KaiC/GvpD/RAD55 family RecA-like ATPase